MLPFYIDKNRMFTARENKRGERQMICIIVRADGGGKCSRDRGMVERRLALAGCRVDYHKFAPRDARRSIPKAMVRQPRRAHRPVDKAVHLVRHEFLRTRIIGIRQHSPRMRRRLRAALGTSASA